MIKDRCVVKKDNLLNVDIKNCKTNTKNFGIFINFVNFS